MKKRKRGEFVRALSHFIDMARDEDPDEEIDVDDELGDLDVDEHVDEYERFHWGNQPDAIKEVQIAVNPRALVQIGELLAVEYVTAKGQRRKDTWRHRFEEPLPVLAYDPDTRKLFIVGGGYTITERGIEK